MHPTPNRPQGGAVSRIVIASGYTLLMALVSISTLPEVDKLFGRTPNYTIDQFVGIARMNAEPSVITVRGKVDGK
jgi:tripartite-type tricarboxylate transporter receptor subunit TctC